MTPENLRHAIEEARRFILRAKELQNKLDADCNDGDSITGYPKQSGAVRRASMDLTRSLAKLRKVNI